MAEFEDGDLMEVCLMLQECRLLVAGGKGVTCRMQAGGCRAREDVFALGANRVFW